MGILDFINKPVSPTELADRLRFCYLPLPNFGYPDPPWWTPSFGALDVMWFSNYTLDQWQKYGIKDQEEIVPPPVELGGGSMLG